MVLSALIALEGDERPGDVSGAQCQSIDKLLRQHQRRGRYPDCQ